MTKLPHFTEYACVSEKLDASRYRVATDTVTVVVDTDVAGEWIVEVPPNWLHIDTERQQVVDWAREAVANYIAGFETSAHAPLSVNPRCSI